MWRLALCALCALCGYSPARAADPASEVRAAADHARTLSIGQASLTRFATLYNIPAEKRLATLRSLSYTLNAVSKNSRIVVPRKLRSSDIVIIDLAAYGIDVAVWESIVSDGEPYFHITTEVLVGGQKKKVFTDAGHVLEDAADLRRTTGSGGALVRADWLVVKLLTPPHYYTATAVPTTLDVWYKALGVDPKVVIALKANRGANMIQSGVTKKPRRLSRYQGTLGGVYQTYDSFGDDAAKDPLRNPSYESRFDAQELIAAKPNGLHVFALFDGEGKRQDAVPDRIAKDDSDPHGNGILQPAISCIRCHVEDGLRPFSNDQQNLDLKGVKIASDSSVPQDDLVTFYDLDRTGKLARQVARDREDYAAAVSQATGGLKSQELAETVAALFRTYEYDLVSPEAALLELGAVSLEPLKVTGDVYLMSLAAGRSIPRRAWEQSYSVAALAITGRQPPPIQLPPEKPVSPPTPKPKLELPHEAQPPPLPDPVRREPAVPRFDSGQFHQEPVMRYGPPQRRNGRSRWRR